jgi:hypothetical protein
MYPKTRRILTYKWDTERGKPIALACDLFRRFGGASVEDFQACFGVDTDCCAHLVPFLLIPCYYGSLAEIIPIELQPLMRNVLRSAQI